MILQALLIVTVLQAPNSPAQATAASDAALMAIANAWVDAWNRHDMDALANTVTEDVDFVTVGGHWLRGRSAFKTHHAERHRTNFRNSSFVSRAVRVQRLRDDVVLMHVEWTISGDENRDGTPRPPSRGGIFTWILTQSNGRWGIRVAHNTNLAEPGSGATNHRSGNH
jgi:uncharacterized protein (TIGR02246 family)